RAALIEPADQVEEKLAAGPGKRQISEFVQEDEVHPGQMLSKPALPSITSLGLEAIDEIDHVIEAPRPASRSNRPDTYQRLPTLPHNLYREPHPVHTCGSDGEVRVSASEVGSSPKGRHRLEPQPSTLPRCVGRGADRPADTIASSHRRLHPPRAD